MAIEYTNRRRKTYYLHQGTTKTGKPKYFFSLKAEGQLVDSMPDGYEIYENPNGQVFLQKIQPQIISKEELEIVKKGIKNLSAVDYYQVESKKDIIIVHIADQDTKHFQQMADMGSIIRKLTSDEVARFSASYTPMMRFILVDRAERKFQPQRYCFRGSIDDWIDIGGQDSLENLVQKFVPHLGRESYYELFGF